MKISKQVRRDAKQLFACCRVNGVLDENRVRLTLKEVIEKRPRGFAAILAHFQRLVKLEVERRTARVECAIPPSDSMKAAVTANLAKRYGPGLTVTFGVSPDLIGGLRVKVGSDVYDGSVKARLGALEENL